MSQENTATPPPVNQAAPPRRPPPARSAPAKSSPTRCRRPSSSASSAACRIPNSRRSSACTTSFTPMTRKKRSQARRPRPHPRNPPDEQAQALGTRLHHQTLTAMIQIRSWVDIADNTGARRATMIGVIGKKSLNAGIGDVITANVKEAAPRRHGEKERSRPRRCRPHPPGQSAAAMVPTSASTTTPSSSSTRTRIRAARASSARSPASSAKRIS